MLRLAAALMVLLTTLPALAQQPICFCARCLLGTHSNLWAPTDSMAPANLPGDCIEARYLLPGDPVPGPGEIVVFRHPVSGDLFFKRIVAVAGQSVQMIDGTLHIDGAPVGVQSTDRFVRPFAPTPTGALPRCLNAPVPLGGVCLAEQWIETLPNGAAYPILNVQDASPLDNTPPFTVPAGHVFVLGDNRDNSLDSRMPLEMGGVGPVPLDLIGGVVEQD